jgi:hypothetical protein
MTKTLADLLREDGAVKGDVYEACGIKYHVAYNPDGIWYCLDGEKVDISYETICVLPADGWRRISPKRPHRVKFEAAVRQEGSQFFISYFTEDNLMPFAGKRVRVTVETLGEEVVE